jgi:hypothetical protein
LPRFVALHNALSEGIQSATELLATLYRPEDVLAFEDENWALHDESLVRQRAIVRHFIMAIDKHREEIQRLPLWVRAQQAVLDEPDSELSRLNSALLWRRRMSNG